jgi:hypothetical protein
MSPTEMGRKIQSSSRKEFPNPVHVASDRFAQVIADALHRDFGDTHAAIKIVVGLTNANERAVKIIRRRGGVGSKRRKART